MKVTIINEEAGTTLDLSNCIEITAEHYEAFKTQAKDIEAIFVYGIKKDRLKKFPKLSRFLKIVSSKFLHTIAEII